MGAMMTFYEVIINILKNKKLSLVRKFQDIL